MSEDRARRIKETMGTPGWVDIAAMLAEQIQEPQSALMEIIAKRPDTLTGRKSVSLAARSRALIDFRESIEDTQKLLANSPQPVRAGNR